MTAEARKVLITTAVLAVSAVAVVPTAAAQSGNDSPARVVTAQGALRDLMPATAGHWLAPERCS